MLNSFLIISFFFSTLLNVLFYFNKMMMLTDYNIKSVAPIWWNIILD